MTSPESTGNPVEHSESIAANGRRLVGKDDANTVTPRETPTPSCADAPRIGRFMRCSRTR